MEGPTLRQRWQRVKLLLQETHTERGALAALLLSARLVLVKGPLLLRTLRASRRAARIRGANARLRASSSPGELCFAFAITGGLGDSLVIARFVRDLAAQCGPFRFDLFSPKPQFTAWAFASLPGLQAAHHDISFNQLLPDYDVCMRLNQHAIVYQHHVNHRALYQRESLVRVIKNLVDYQPRIDVFIQHHPWMDNYLSRFAVFSGATRRDYLHLMAGLQYGGDRLVVPQDIRLRSRLGLSPGSYVTVHNGFDTDFVITGQRATKCYPHFGAVVATLRRLLPELRFVQIGTTTSEPIAQCDLVLLHQTTLDEASGLIAGAALHLDNEGGMVHLAACLGTSSAVLFGPTPSDYFGYPGNLNIDPPVCGNCWWMKRSWMDVCAKGYDTPLCLTEQDPERVAGMIYAALRPTGRPALARASLDTGAAD
jgi:hypothetical protein